MVSQRPLPSSGLQVGIVGGSISGCTAAIALMRAGCDVTVFERSSGALQGRDAGIGTPPPVIRALQERDFIDTGLPLLTVDQMTYRRRASPHDRIGQAAWRQHHELSFMHWGDLYRSLRHRVPDERYRSGTQVASLAEVDEEHIILQVTTGEELTFDLVLFADGYRSLGRQLLFPDLHLRYGGYVAWRGLVDEDVITTPAPLEGTGVRVGYDGGHGIFYFVPGLAGRTGRHQRLINWAVYVVVDEAELPAMLTDREGQFHDGSLPPGTMPVAREESLKQAFREHFPPYFSTILQGSEETFVQAIYDVAIPAYRAGRICLIGDAGALAPPHTGSGVFKAMQNAIDLADALDGSTSVEAALTDWNAAQTRTGNSMVVYGRQSESALVSAIPNWLEMDEAAMEAWWSSVIAQRQRAFEQLQG